jgi:hypothetical protein
VGSSARSREDWHEHFGCRTIADAVLQRLATAFIASSKGERMRKLCAAKAKPDDAIVK